MKFSIIVPVYNVEKYLPRCVESILGQSYDDYEVILVDDGSGDGSGKLCDFYMDMDRRVRALHQGNLGQADARNSGLDIARGEWIVFVDSDDWIEADMLEVLNREISSSPADLYRYNIKKVDEEGRLLERLLYCAENGEQAFCTEKGRFDFYVNVFMQYRMGWEVWGGVYRRNLIQKYNMRFKSTREIFAEDYLFTFQYLLYVYKVRMLCNIFYNYVQRDVSTMSVLNQAEVLPRLIKWGEWGYVYVKKAGLRYFVRNFEELYFMLINYHVQYLLKEMPLEKVRSCIWNQGGRLHGRWLKKLKKEEKDKGQWKKYMGMRIWL